MKRNLAWAAVVLMACLSSPTPPAEGPFRQGGGSDTETLTGRVTGADGIPANGVPVKLLPAAYDPSHPDTSNIRRSVTDANGQYRFDSVDTHRLWNVIAGDKNRNAWALARDRKPGLSVPLTLKTAQVFLVTLHVANYASSDSGIAFFPGTDILTRCDSRSVSAVDSVPAEALRFVVESRAGWRHDTTLTAALDTARIRADKNQIVITP